MATAIHDIEKMAATWEPRMRDAFIAAVNEWANSIDLSALARALENGDVSGALQIVGIDPAHFSGLVVTQTAAFNAGGVAAARAAPLLPQIAGHTVRVLFDVRNPRAEAWIRNESSQLVTDIVADQRVAIRDYLEKGLQAGKNPRNVALDLVGRVPRGSNMRQGGVIGLTSQQEQWLLNYEAQLASSDPAMLKQALSRELRDKRFDATVLKAIKDGSTIPAEVQEKMRQLYANAALKYRGDVIARNETIKALGVAQREAYQQSIDKGHLDQSLITKFPVTAGDERVRPTHRAVPGMNPEGRKWNEPYQTPFGPQMHAPYPNEIQCRCHERIKVDFLGAAVAKHKAANSG